MISASDRRQAVELIQQAHDSGASLERACAEVGINVRTYQRWRLEGGVKSDGRPQTQRPPPANKLSAEEHAAVLARAHEPAYASLPPAQSVGRLTNTS